MFEQIRDLENRIEKLKRYRDGDAHGLLQEVRNELNNGFGVSQAEIYLRKKFEARVAERKIEIDTQIVPLERQHAIIKAAYHTEMYERQRDDPSAAERYDGYTIGVSFGEHLETLQEKAEFWQSQAIAKEK